MTPRLAVVCEIVFEVGCSHIHLHCNLIAWDATTSLICEATLISHQVTYAFEDDWITIYS